MTILQAVLLGIVQGLTEFLPISSSAHLVLTPYFAAWEIPATEAFIFDVLVQMGTLVAVIVYFWKDLWAIGRAWVLGLIHKQPFGDFNARLGWFILLSTLPAVVIGLLIKDQVEAAFDSPLATGIFLFGTAILLVIAERFGQRQRQLTSLTWVDALWIGAFQAISLFPGISRSGSTITGGMLRNLNRQAAARFSFLMSAPVMLAAGLLTTVEWLQAPDAGAISITLLVGFMTAAVVGYLAIRWLLQYLVQHSLYIFAAYCVVLGTSVVVVYLLR
jgi:undecaprenyl-diphosphatase